MASTIVLDGDSLTIQDLVRIARDPQVRVARAPEADARVVRAETLIKNIVDEYQRKEAAGRRGPDEYGVTTGFGEFKRQAIHPKDLEELQRNLLLSHSVGVGETSSADDLANYFPAEIVRGALATRLNAFLKGHSGLRLRLVEIVQAMLNCGVIPLVPLRGSVGASGDLCPLSHLFVALLGEGRFYVVKTAADVRRGPRELVDAKHLAEVLRSELPGLHPDEMAPRPKEALALTNGVNFSTAMLALGVHDAEHLVDAADTAAAFTLEVLGGCTRALDEKVHAARGHEGQKESARRILSLVDGSSLVESAGEVQDPYSLRCAPQVHGASRDAIRYARGVAETEINAATDNPLFFPDGAAPVDHAFSRNWPANYDGKARQAYSAGNFHGQPIALAADFLGIAVAELASISERRTQMMLDEHHNRRLPANLTTRPGVNSGLMIAQYTAASLVSENKVLAHPASVDSIPTSANTEDHVSMSTHAARKLRTMIGNSQAVVAIELMTAAQAADWRIGMGLKAAEERKPLESIAEADRQADDFRAVTQEWEKKILPALAVNLQPVYRAIRNRVPAVVRDRVLDADVAAIRGLVESGLPTSL